MVIEKYPDDFLLYHRRALEFKNQRQYEKALDDINIVLNLIKEGTSDYEIYSENIIN